MTDAPHDGVAPSLEMLVPRWLIIAAAVVFAAASIVEPLVLIGPLVILPMPAMQYWSRRGVLADVSTRWTHPAALIAAQAAGMPAGVYLLARHPGVLAPVGEWAIVMIVLSMSMAFMVAVFRATQPAQGGREAARAAVVLSVVLMCAFVAWVASVAAPETSLVADIAVVVLAGNTASALWGLAVLAPRPSRRAAAPPAT